MKYFFAAVFYLVLSSSAAAQIPAATVPDFTFYNFNQTPFSNKDLTPGKPLFFIFFDTECDHCRRAVGYLSQHIKQLDKAAVYMLSLATPAKMNSFITTYGNNLNSKKNIRFLVDMQNQFILRFKPKKYPSVFLYTAKKQLVMYDDEEKNMYKFLDKLKTIAGK